MKIFADQSKGIERDLRNTMNVVGDFVTRAEVFSWRLKNSVRLAQHENEAEA